MISLLFTSRLPSTINCYYHLSIPRLLISLALASLLSPAVLLASDSSSPFATIQTAWSHPRARPADRRVLALVLELQPGWHINPDPAHARSIGSFVPIPTTLRVLQAPPGLLFETPRFPPPQEIPVRFADQPVPLLSGHLTIYLPVQLPPDLAPGDYPLLLELFYQACDEKTCLFPATLQIPLTLQVIPPNQDPGPLDRRFFHPDDPLLTGTPRPDTSIVLFNVFNWSYRINAAHAAGLAAMFLIALFGGLLLNFTPCVLPVIPIKILTLARAAEHPTRCLILGLIMSLGILAFWLALGLSISWLALLGSTSQLFQKPPFTIAVGLLIAVMALGLCDLFSIPLPPRLYAFEPRPETPLGSFLFGIMTAVLSTPCTAPFMGAALAWAVKQPPLLALAVFLAVGIGMALPYLLLSAFPRLVHRLPRAGPGSQLLKQTMALFLLAAAAYFLGTGLTAWFTQPPDPPSRLYWWAVAAFIAAAGFWLLWRTFRIHFQPSTRLILTTLSLLTIAVGLYTGLRLTDPGPIPWSYYTPQRLDQALAQQRAVLLNFTAEWCLNCKALEQTALHQPDVVAALRRPEILPMKVDLTSYNPLGLEKLRQTGRITIPWLVVLAPDGSTVFASEAYTASQILQAIETALKRTSP